MITLGVLSDTHIPDRARSLDPRVISHFRNAGVSAILHAGDVSSPGVLEQLGQVAPVYAVRGNRDWLWLGRLPLALRLEFAGIQIGLTHGHGRWWNYVLDRIYFLARGYHLERLIPRMRAAFPEARVIVFGHSHKPHNFWMEGQLLFNPGSPHFPDKAGLAPSIGLLHLQAGGEVRGEIIHL